MKIRNDETDTNLKGEKDLNCDLIAALRMSDADEIVWPTYTIVITVVITSTTSPPQFLLHV